VKLIEVVMTQVIRFMRVSSKSGGIYLPEAVQAMRERYGFLKAPTSLEEYDPAQGVTFSHGKFLLPEPVRTEGMPAEILIDRFQIYTNGVLVQTRTYSTVADLFLDDLLTWAIERFQLSYLDDSPVRKGYLSQLNVFLDADLNTFMRGISSLSKKVNALIEKYGQKAPTFEVSGFSLHGDTTQQIPLPVPTVFSIERKAQVPYKSKTYFAQAPLTTTDHLEALELLEKIAKNTHRTP
jgi:hypothetical protein